MEAKELRAFTEEIAELFNQGKIHCPVHLSAGNEEQLLDIFKDVRPQDWVFSTHRSHFHALLKGIPMDWLREQILQNKSMHINSKEYRFFTSSIVGGVCPIALGVALDIKRGNRDERVWCCVGDMAARTGIFYECVRYAEGFDLPIMFIVEDNGYSVETKTGESWGTKQNGDKIRYYSYERIYPHANTGKIIHW